METIRKAVESLTGDAGVGHAYGDTGAPTATTGATATSGERGGGDVGAQSRLTARRSPDVTTTTATIPSGGREETWQRERGGQYGGRDEYAGRSEEAAAAGGSRAPLQSEGGVSGLQADEEHRRMAQQQAARQSDIEQRTTGKEAGAMGMSKGGERGEEKPVTQKIKETLGMGGAEAQRSEQGRQLGFERGQGRRHTNKFNRRERCAGGRVARRKGRSRESRSPNRYPFTRSLTR